MAKKPNELDGLGRFGALLFDIGWQLAIITIGLLWLGDWVDKRFGTDPLFILLALVLVVLSFVVIVRRTLLNIPRSRGGLKDD